MTDIPQKEWIIVFADGPPCWWDLFTRPGFRHVVACSVDAELGTWTFYDPSRLRTEIWSVPVGRPLAHDVLHAWLRDASAVIRFRAVNERRRAPAVFCCVGAVKALLGVRCWAVTPHGLFRALIKRGAQPVDVKPFRRQPASADTAAGPDHAEPAQPAAAAG